MQSVTFSTPTIKLEATPITISTTETSTHHSSTTVLPASRFADPHHLRTYRTAKKRFVISWAVFRQYLVDNHGFDTNTGVVVYAVAPSFDSKAVKNDQTLNKAFRDMREGRGGVGFWVVGEGLLDSKQPVSKQEYLAEAYSDGEDEVELSESQDERVQKWQKGLVKAEPPKDTTTAYD